MFFLRYSRQIILGEEWQVRTSLTDSDHDLRLEDCWVNWIEDWNCPLVLWTAAPCGETVFSAGLSARGQGIPSYSQPQQTLLKNTELTHFLITFGSYLFNYFKDIGELQNKFSKSSGEFTFIPEKKKIHYKLKKGQAQGQRLHCEIQIESNTLFACTQGAESCQTKAITF